MNRHAVVLRTQDLYKEMEKVWSQSYRLPGAGHSVGVREWYQTLRLERFRLEGYYKTMGGMENDQLIDFAYRLITFSQILDVTEDVILLTQVDKSDMCNAAENLGCVLP